MTEEIVLFESEDHKLVLEVQLRDDTVWLNTLQMAELFERDETTIRKHINNAFFEKEVNQKNNTQKMRIDGVK